MRIGIESLDVGSFLRRRLRDKTGNLGLLPVAHVGRGTRQGIERGCKRFCRVLQPGQHCLVVTALQPRDVHQASVRSYVGVESSCRVADAVRITG